ncbi:MAG TPA: aminoacyl-tRNA deacylase, partial [Burkholderiales bacterium]|nr:aminoacyl-tRNA deacylase [Burkholderiales bacterium]
ESAVSREYGLEAAAAVGVPAGMVYKTLVAKLDAKRLAVALVPVSSELDLKALATLAEAKRAEMATPQEAERATGYVVGSISPLGQRRRLETYIDSAVMKLTNVYVSAGRRGLEIELAPGDLVACCQARLGSIAR